MAINVTLAGNRATNVRLSIPAWGASYADVTLDGEYTLSGAITLVVADLTVQCTILSGGPAVGTSYYRVVAGAGGWGQSLKSKSYNNDAGVKLTNVLQDAASACGESFDTTTIPSTRLGSYWTRPADLACRVLEQTSPNAWYVREDGKTCLGQRPTPSPPSAYAVVSQVDLAQAKVVISSDSIASILPGVVISGLTAVDVEHEVSAKGGIRSTIWGQIGSGMSRRLSALRAQLDQLDPLRKFRGAYEYRITTLNAKRMNLQCVRTSLGMPDVQGVLPRPGNAGESCSPALGSRVVVVFLNGDPTNPIVIGYENPEAGGFLPTTSTVDASSTLNLGPSATSVAVGGGSLPVARQGDQVTCFLPPALAVVGTVSGSPFTGTITVPNPISGSISGPCSSVLKTK